MGFQSVLNFAVKEFPGLNGVGSGNLRSKAIQDRKLIEILQILSEQNKPVGARLIARKLSERGYRIGERAVRYYLKMFDELGLTRNLSYDGRLITQKGLEELKNALASDRVGFVITRIESLIFKMDFDLKRRTGKVIANIALLGERRLREALEVMAEAISAGYATSPLIRIFEEGEEVAGRKVPEGKVMVATVCSITLDGILHRVGIPVTPLYGGIVQVLDGKPLRFTELISYSGSTLDPLEVFSAKGLTSILKTVKTGNGYVLANMREIPMDAAEKAERVLERAREALIGGVITIGKPNSPVLGVPVKINRVGIALYGGINPLVAVMEKGIPLQVKAIASLIDIREFVDIRKLKI